MELMVIGHPAAVLGFSLAGVSGQIATSAEEVNRALDDALAKKGVGIILVTEEVAVLIKERMENLKMHSTVPLVVEIPGPGVTPPGKQPLSEVVRRAIGIKL
jgi:V/A-type H+/Na+-transporting ATPase subunit F